MTIYEKQPESKTTIRFHDCDPFRHLNNAKYIDYIIDARGDHLLHYYNFNMFHLATQKKLGWVAATTQLSYFYPAFPAEIVTIQTRLLHFTDKSLLLEGLMWNENKSHLKTLLWTKLVHFDLHEQKSTVHAPELIQFFSNIVNPLPGPTTFEQRIHSLKHKP